MSRQPVTRRRVLSVSEALPEDGTQDPRELARRDLISCAVCYCNIGKYCLVPCGHGKMCGMCINNLADVRANCPFCRGPIHDWIKVRDAMA